MRYAVFSDIHSNLPALEAVIKALRAEKVDAYCCIGDFVGYGANPNECVALIKDLNVVGVAGNHDWGVLGKTDISYFNVWAQEAVIWTRTHISEDVREFLEKLRLIEERSEFVLVHGTLNEPENFYYLSDISEAAETFRFLKDHRLCFVGHTHVPHVFVQKAEHDFTLPIFDFTIEEKCRYIINVGSVGQPRDGDRRAAYCIYDDVTKRITIKRVEYDVGKAQKQILEAGLPPFLATRLAFGQ